MPKNIGIDTNLDSVNICNFFDFWPPGGTKVAQNGTSSLGKVWKSCMVSQDTPQTTFPYRNLCIFGVSIIAYFDHDLPVLISKFQLPF